VQRVRTMGIPDRPISLNLVEGEDLAANILCVLLRKSAKCCEADRGRNCGGSRDGQPRLKIVRSAQCAFLDTHPFCQGIPARADRNVYLLPSAGCCISPRISRLSNRRMTCAALLYSSPAHWSA
jgi:hypothetical protein